MSEPKSAGASGKAIDCLCYAYDEKKGLYREVKLRKRGDWNSDNLSPAAKELADWLESLNAEVNPPPKRWTVVGSYKQLLLQSSDDNNKLLGYLTGGHLAQGKWVSDKATIQAMGEMSVVKVVAVKCEYSSDKEPSAGTPSCSFIDYLQKPPKKIIIQKTEAVEFFKLLKKTGIEPSPGGRSINATEINCMGGGIIGSSLGCWIQP
jgi:hypothetical protein